MFKKNKGSNTILFGYITIIIFYLYTPITNSAYAQSNHAERIQKITTNFQQTCDKRFGKIEFASPKKNQSYFVCRTGYASYYDIKAQVPLLVYYSLNKQKILGCEKRSEVFKQDPFIAQSLKPSDFTHSKYDRGHLAPAADLAWSKITEEESYYTSNIAPQTPGFNRGVWKNLEVAVRSYVYTTNNEVVVITGSVYNELLDKIQINYISLTIPYAFYKIIINKKTKVYYAYFMLNKNTNNVSKDLSLIKDLHIYRINQKQLEQETKNRMFVLDEYSEAKDELEDYFKGNLLQEDKKLLCKDTK